MVLIGPKVQYRCSGLSVKPELSTDGTDHLQAIIDVTISRLVYRGLD